MSLKVAQQLPFTADVTKDHISAGSSLEALAASYCWTKTYSSVIWSWIVF